MMLLRRFAILLSLSGALFAHAEVLVSTAGVDAFRVLDIVETEGEAATLLIAANDIYRSGSGGESWIRQATVSGYVDITWGNATTYAIDTNLRTRADGSGWTLEGVALPTGIVRGTRIAADSSNVLMVGVDEFDSTQLYQLAHGSTTWIEVGAGLPADELIDVMTTSNAVLVATDSQGVWISSDGGANFVDTDQPDIRVLDWAVGPTGTLVIATDGTGIYRNTTSGAGSWDNSSLDGVDATSVGIGSDLILYAGTAEDGLHRSTSWPTFTSGADNGALEALLDDAPLAISAIGRTSDEELLVGTLGRGVFKTEGLNFDVPSLPPEGGEISDLLVGRTNLEAFLATLGGGIFGTGDGGATWINVSVGLANRDVHTLALQGSFVYAGTDDGLWRADATLLLWVRVGDDDLGGTQVVDLIRVEDRFVAATSAGIQISDDNGLTWSVASASVVDRIAYAGSALWASASGIFLTSADDGSTWGAAGTTGVVGTVQRAFVAGGDVWLAVTDGLYRSDDQAASWTEVDAEITPVNGVADYVLVFSDIEGVIYVSEASGGLRVSFDDGLRWRDLYVGFPRGTGGGLEPIRSYAEVIAPDPEEGEERASGALLLGIGDVGAYGSSAVLHRLLVPRHPPNALNALDSHDPITRRDKPHARN